MSTDEAEVRATIDRYWDAWFAAVANPPNPDSPELNQLMTGLSYDRTIAFVREIKSRGQFVRLPLQPRFSRRVVSLTFDNRGIATVKECVVDDTELIDARNGAVVMGGLTTSEFTSTIRRFDDGWRFTTHDETKKVNGEASCGS